MRRSALRFAFVCTFTERETRAYNATRNGLASRDVVPERTSEVILDGPILAARQAA